MLINWPEKRSSAEHPYYCIGGDGTLSAAEAVVGTIPFGVISRGTANAFATALGVPTTIEAACQTILDGKTRVVDAAYCGKPMVLLAGIGFEAETVEPTEEPFWCWLMFGRIQALRNLPSFEARVETEDKIVTLRLQRSQLPMPLPTPGSRTGRIAR